MVEQAFPRGASVRPVVSSLSEKGTWLMQGFPFSRKTVTIATTNRENNIYFLLAERHRDGFVFQLHVFFSRLCSVSVSILRAIWLILEHFETIISFGGTASTTRAPILEIPRASSGPCTPRWRQ